jgi:hypothetical protein
VKHAPFDSRLGQLQRGLGQGFLAALAEPDAAGEEVLQCILRDPRLDAQIERREAYYAELAQALHLDLAPLVAAADEAGLAVGVLAELAARRHPQALALLVDPEPHPEASAAVLEELRGHPEWDAAGLRLPAVAHLADALAARDDLIFDVEVYAAFWEPWRAALPVVEEAFVEAAARAAAEVLHAPSPLRDPRALSTVELLVEAGGENSNVASAELQQRASESDRAILAEWIARAEVRPGAMAVAAKALGSFGDLRLLAAAEAIFARTDLDVFGAATAVERQRRAAYHHYVRALPAAVTLPIVRLWWPRGGQLRIAAGHVFAEHAEPQDRAWLEEFVQRAAGRSSSDAVSEIDALVRIGDVRSLPVLLMVVEQATYSWARTRALRGVAAHPADPRAQAALAAALWDSEDDARELGCRHAELASPRARARVAQLAAMPLVDASVREAASARLAVDAVRD